MSLEFCSLFLTETINVGYTDIQAIMALSYHAKWPENILLLPANEVWGKVIFSQACVKNSVYGGTCSGGVPAPGGCLLQGGYPVADPAAG